MAILIACYGNNTARLKAREALRLMAKGPEHEEFCKKLAVETLFSLQESRWFMDNLVEKTTLKEAIEVYDTKGFESLIIYNTFLDMKIIK